MSEPVEWKIPLNNGFFALVDKEDYAYLMRWTWRVRLAFGNHYAVRMEQYTDSNGKRKRRSVHMHREVLGLTFKDGQQCDHIETGSTLDNRRSNLRIATSAQNLWNRGPMKNNKAGVKGVWQDKRWGSWQARINVNKKAINLGTFKTKLLAAKAYSDAAKIYHGEFARTI